MNLCDFFNVFFSPGTPAPHATSLAAPLNALYYAVCQRGVANPLAGGSCAAANGGGCWTACALGSDVLRHCTDLR